MPDPPKTRPKHIEVATITFVLVENADGVRSCEVSSAVDEAVLTPSDAAKMQHKLTIWHTYFLSVFLRKLEQIESAAKEISERVQRLERSSSEGSKNK